ATVLDDDRLNALQMEKPRKHEPGRARADDSDLSAHHRVLGYEVRRIVACPLYGKGMKTGKPCTIALVINALANDERGIDKRWTGPGDVIAVAKASHARSIAQTCPARRARVTRPISRPNQRHHTIKKYKNIKN